MRGPKHWNTSKITKDGNKLPLWNSFDWEKVGAVQLWMGWSVCRRGCLKGKSAHANCPTACTRLEINTWPPPPHLRRCRRRSEWTAFVYYVMFSCLSRGRSTTSPYCQTPVHTNHVYSRHVSGLFYGRSHSLLNERLKINTMT